MLLFEPVEHGERQDLWCPAWRKEVKELYSYVRLLDVEAEAGLPAAHVRGTCLHRDIACHLWLALRVPWGFQKSSGLLFSLLL